MNEIEPQDTKTVFNLSARVAAYVSSIEMTLLDESGLLEKLGEQIEKEELKREEYSPIFAAMNSDDREEYDELYNEIMVASQVELMFGQDNALTETFMRRVSSPAIRMQELLVSVAVREKLMEDDDIISLWPTGESDGSDADLLEKYEAPLLASIASTARP